MIEKIQIQNFQSHKRTKLEFDDGVNVIVGSSDCGKTAILRAINWVMTNKPSGDTFKSYWGGKTFVKIKMKDCGSSITRTKDKSNNSYAYNDEVYKAFGQSIPKEIEQELNFNNLNIQHQLESPFLFSKSSGEIAQYLNKTVGLDDIDNSAKTINSTARKNKTDLKYENETLDKLQESLLDFDDLEKMENDVGQLSLLENELYENKELLKELSNLVSEIEQEKLELNNIPNYKGAGTIIDSLIYNDELLEDVITEKKNLKILVKTIISEQETISIYSKRLSNLKKEYKKLMPDICPLCLQEIKK